MPNHPHPGALDTPPGALLAGLIAKVAAAGGQRARRASPLETSVNTAEENISRIKDEY